MNLNNYVEEIISDINKNGIESVKKYSRKFDDYEGKLKVSDGEWEKAKEIPDQDKEIIEKTIDRIFRYHETQIEEDNIFLEDSSIYGTIYRSLERVGLYVPGGKPLPSSLMMTGVPARIAGVDEIVVTSPPSDGEIDPYVLYTADALGFNEVYKIGGVQAIASMAYGIGMERVDKIFGPGNKYVNEAKRQVYGDVGIDSLAGPSDICVIADDSADEDSVLMDLLSQLEHGESSEAWLLTTSQDLADYCSGEDVEIFVFNDLGECVRKSNEIAPEHLEIITDNPLDLVDDVQNAGAIYLGEYTPVPAADYFLGVNHVLPTGSAARFDSVLTVMDFMKPISLAYVSEDEFKDESYLGIRLAEIEDMDYHKKSMEARLE